jgi:hypothetical protein
MAPKTSSRRLTEEEREGIVLARLRGEPIRKVAADWDTSLPTVVAVFKKYLAARVLSFETEIQAERAQIVARLERIANDARVAGSAAEDRDLPRLLAEERSALAQIGKILGLESHKVEVSGDAGFTVLRIVEIVEPAAEDGDGDE